MVRPREAAVELDMDGILHELGHFGRYQVTTFILILLPITLSGAYNGQYIFAAGDTPYRCLVPECEAQPAEWAPGAWAAWALPAGAWGSWGQPRGERCHRARPLAGGSACTPASFNHSLSVQCQDFVYENDDTIVSEFGLACQDWKRTLVGTMHSTGIFTALFITGFLSDTFGRRKTFILTASLRALPGVARSFSHNYVMYIVLEFCDALISSGVYSTGFILALEMLSRKRRVLGGSIISCSFAIGQILLATLAWHVPYWRHLTLILYGPAVLFLFYYCCMEESIRWLLSKGYKKEATRIIYKAAAMNNKTLSPRVIKHLNEEQQPKTPQKFKTKKTPGAPVVKKRSLAWQVLKSRIMMSRLGICSFWWITVTFIYYGLSINSVSLAGNMYVNYILTSLVEIPGYGISVLTLDRFGRKGSIMTALFICGAALLTLPFIPSTWSGATMTLNLVGKMFDSMAISSIYVYTLELFPTPVRHRVLACCCMAGRVGEMLAPQTPLLMKYMASLPYMIFGAMAGCAGALMLLTPETLSMPLPDTVAQAENVASTPRTRDARLDVLDY